MKLLAALQPGPFAAVFLRGAAGRQASAEHIRDAAASVVAALEACRRRRADDQTRPPPCVRRASHDSARSMGSPSRQSPATSRTGYICLRSTARVLLAVTGLKPLSLGDVEAGTLHMRPIHSFLASDVVFANDRRALDDLQPKARAALLAVVAGFLPFYTFEAQVRGSASLSVLQQSLLSRLLSTLRCAALGGDSLCAGAAGA